MADFSPNTVQPPSLLVSVVTRIGSHLFTLAAGALAADGVFTKDQSIQFVSLGAAALTWGVGYAWNEWLAYQHRKNTAAQVAQAKAS